MILSASAVLVAATGIVSAIGVVAAGAYLWRSSDRHPDQPDDADGAETRRKDDRLVDTDPGSWSGGI
jgi:hypothetical protein